MLRLASALFVFAGLSATSRALPSGELAKGGTVPAGTAMVRRTVTLSRGRADAPTVTLPCPVGTRVADLIGARGATGITVHVKVKRAELFQRPGGAAVGSVRLGQPVRTTGSGPRGGARSRPTPARPLGALPRVSVDAAMIGAVFTNLLMNGLKYGPREGGTIRVGASREPAGWRFVVESEGQTIALEDRNRIFEPYRRGRGERRARGSGLGLAICRDIVERNGGRIGVDAAEGGNRFYFTLPDG